METEGRLPNDFPADVITDLATKGDELSVFEVSSTISAERIATALAGGKRQLQETGYAVFDRAAVVDLGINPKKVNGGTVDADVNGCHYDLEVGTVAKLVDLAGVIAAGDVLPILKNDVEALLRAGLENGQLDSGRMQPELREKLQKKG